MGDVACGLGIHISYFISYWLMGTLNVENGDISLVILVSPCKNQAVSETWYEEKKHHFDSIS